MLTKKTYMNTNEAFLNALNQEGVKSKYSPSSVRTWRSRAIREKLSLDFMIEFLRDNGFKIKQPLQWHIVENNKALLKKNGEHAELTANDHSHGAETKAQLNKKLYAVRKQLNADLYNRWYEWSKAEYAKDFAQKTTALTPVVFSQMTYGRYISKENIPFAVKILKEGTKLLSEYHEQIRLEVESL
jgi:hypothetical protein